MPGKRIKNPTLAEQVSFNPLLRVMVDKMDDGNNDWIESRNMKIGLLGNTYIQGSENNVNWHDGVLEGDLHFRVSTDGGQSWLSLFGEGPQGDQGDQGPQGEVGAQGDQGDAGAQGDQGPQGEQGTQGLTGDQGEKGEQGDTGVQGDQGEIGPQGDQGETGAQGVQGSQGETGPQGDQGHQGEKGDTGDQGPQGDQGEKGNDGTSVTILGSVDTYTDLPGYPDTYTGDIGDGYLTDDNGHLWVWNGSDWIDAGEIRGPQGEQGYQGEKGDQGDQGDTGSQGPQGHQGETGDQGPQGTTGEQGDQGATGPQGEIGEQGETGAQGPQGYQGIDGEEGPQGVQGETGSQGPQGENGADGEQGPQGDQGDQGPQGESSSEIEAIEVNQDGHGFIVGDVIRHNTIEYVKAQANNATNSQASGIVSEIIDSNNFKYLSDGYIPSLGTPGEEYFLSPDTPGEIITLSDPEEWSIGEVRLSIGWGTSAGLKVEIDIGDVIEEQPVLEGAQGPQGDQGEVGETGPQGEQGEAGPQGETGEQGDQGFQGHQGTQGEEGPQGVQGSQGHQGEEGPQGLTGDQGEKGDQGPQGEQGYQGHQGSDGTGVNILGSVADETELDPAYTGESGDGYITEDDGHLWVWNGSDWIDAGLIRGPQGDQGVQGSTGDQGPQGEKGDQGYQGETGNQGSTGDQGPQGLRGYQGYQGHQGLTGDEGPQGDTGATGDRGPQGYQGVRGYQGYQGVAGDDGSVWHSGSSAPSSSLGQIGDYYFRTSSGYVYEKTGSSTWTYRANITGPQGPRGDQGYQGTQGTRGYQGYQGYQGTRGYQGYQGVQGAQGETGDSMWSYNSTSLYPNISRNVGIGTSNAKAKLQVNGIASVGYNDAFGLNIYYDGGWRTIETGASAFIKQDNNFHIAVSPSESGGTIASLKTVFSIDPSSGDATFSDNVYADNFILSSSRKLKENIEPIENNIQLIDDVKFYKFNFKADPNKRSRYGVIAEELEEIAPEFVYENNDIKTVGYIDLLIAKVAALEKRIKYLENK